MASPQLQYIIILSLLLLTINLLQSTNATKIQNGFNLKMIHRDSPKSPIHHANLTEIDKLKKHIEISHARTKSLAKFYNNTNNNDDLIIRPKIGVSLSDYYWYVQIGIGTLDRDPSFYTYNLGLDTGSDITWLQCEGCAHCFPTPAPYPVSQSLSYKRLSSQDCAFFGGDLRGDDCLFEREYADGAKLIALASNETLVIAEDDATRYLDLDDYIFGCGIDMLNFDEDQNPNNIISGLLGMGNHELTLWSQARDISLGKFSYCLQSLSDAQTGSSPMYLRFGNDITQVQPPQMQSTPITFYSFNPEYYYLTLLGITVHTDRLPLDPAIFAVKADNSGGCIIDSGTPISYIVTEAYNPLLDAVINFIEALNNGNLRKLDPPDSLGYRLCYQVIDSTLDVFLPEITYHFANNADFVVQNDASFNFINRGGNSLVCLMIDESTTQELNNINVLGTYQQTDQRIIFDVFNSQLSFAPQGCLQNN